MNANDELIPPPPVVQEKLARNYREARILRSLLRLSVRFAKEAYQRQLPEHPQAAACREGGR